MGHIIVETAWQYHGLQAICIENSLLRIVVLPELGGKIFRLIHKPSDTGILWQNPRLIPRRLPTGSRFDDHFYGGWDELFPNDEPTSAAGEPYPDHGELWTLPWQAVIEEESDEQAVLHMWCYGSVTTARLDRWLTVKRDSPLLTFRYELVNMSHTGLDFLWKLHPALNISPSSRIDLPPCTVIRGDREFSFLVGEERFPWPVCRGKDGDDCDLRFMFGSGRPFKEFVYCIDLENGWCAMTDSEKRVGFGMHFPKEIFTSVWLFITDGGWRGYRTAILEPCTAYPFLLDKAIEQGTCGHLNPGETLKCEVEAVVYEGLSGVKGIESGGQVIGI
ncbi:DUF5107 domain-containing protein [bacterium]|nr:DUF5107 domain-containing protein [bacterium]